MLLKLIGRGRNGGPAISEGQIESPSAAPVCTLRSSRSPINTRPSGDERNAARLRFQECRSGGGSLSNARAIVLRRASIRELLDLVPSAVVVGIAAENLNQFFEGAN